MKARRDVIIEQLRFGLPPALAVILLLVLPGFMPNRVVASRANDVRRVAIAAAVENAPYRFGGWVGTEVETPPVAVRMLHPNAILSRRFEHLDGGPAVSVLLVHCTDARDMGSHYPPVCYPFSGWSFVGSSAGRPAELLVAGTAVPVRVYEFRRIAADGREARIRILNCFVLPDGEVVRDIGRLKELYQRPALAAQGVAQIQIVTSAAADEAGVAEAAAEILSGLGEIMEALGLKDGLKDGPDV